jgi:hypothetical protein
MSGAQRSLHVVPPRASGDEDVPRDRDDVGLTLMIFLVAAVPLASVAAGIGRWDAASLGLGTLGVLLAGRELYARLVARRGSGRRS